MFWVRGSGFWVQGFRGSRFWVPGFRVLGSRFWVQGFKVQGLAQPPAKKTDGQIEKETLKKRISKLKL
jgi:hypothetical protein